ncbi:MAG: transcription termination factor Rho [Actinomycetota bacterium]|jgi:transcription termination factor Rho
MAAQALEQSALESKDKAQLIQIAEALGAKVNARSKKAEIIEQILAKTAGPAPAEHPAPAGRPAPVSSAPTPTPAADPSSSATPPAATTAAPPVPSDEPKAEWELDVDAAETDGDTAEAPRAASSADATERAPRHRDQQRPQREQRPGGAQRPQSGDGQGGSPEGGPDGDGESRNKRRRRRKKKHRDDGPQGEDRDLLDVDEDQPVSNEPVQIEGYLDIRDEGYGFVRVNNYLASKSDAYIPVKLSKQFGLRKGDHVVATSRAASRNEKNPPVLEIKSVNGRSPEEARKRRRFEDLTALFPDSRLRMEDPSDPTNMTARIIDLVSPIGKGQRGIIVSPPKAGKTTVMKTIAQSIEKNHPECKLIVLLIDERPEEVTDMRRLVKGEVIASTFDKPSDQHTQIAEMCIEKAKRMVEAGEDVVVILDGITRLSRAYNLAAPASGRILSGGIDAGALYPPKRFFGAARNVEEGGSLTILATALVETNSRMDEAVFEEFKGTGNMELRLDRRLAERRIYPAIDVDASSTRHEELLFDRKQLQMVWKLRRVLSGLAADGNAAPGLELLVDRLKTFRTNDEFLTEIAKQPGM